MIRLFLLCVCLCVCVCVSGRVDRILKEKRRRRRRRRRRERRRKSTIPRPSYCVCLVSLRERERERATEEKKFQPMSLSRVKGTLRLIGNGRTMNKERKCSTLKTNEKSGCKRASPACFSDIWFKEASARIPRRYRIHRTYYRWRNDDRQCSPEGCFFSSLFDQILTLLFLYLFAILFERNLSTWWWMIFWGETEKHIMHLSTNERAARACFEKTNLASVLTDYVSKGKWRQWDIWVAEATFLLVLNVTVMLDKKLELKGVQSSNDIHRGMFEHHH